MVGRGVCNRHDDGRCAFMAQTDEIPIIAIFEGRAFETAAAIFIPMQDGSYGYAEL